MPNYQSSQIYCMEVNGLYYIGSTAQKKLSTRIAQHRANFKRYNNSGKNKYYCNSFKLLELDLNPIYDTIEFYECDNKEELSKRERYYIELYKEKYGVNCVNKQIPNRSKNEWNETNRESNKIKMKEYYHKNKDKNRKERNKKERERREKNKEEINKKAREYRLLNKDKINKQQRERRLKNKTNVN